MKSFRKESRFFKMVKFSRFFTIDGDILFYLFYWNCDSLYIRIFSNSINTANIISLRLARVMIWTCIFIACTLRLNFEFTI